MASALTFTWLPPCMSWLAIDHLLGLLQPARLRPSLDAADSELDGNVVNRDLANPKPLGYLGVGELGVGNDCVPHAVAELPDNLLVCLCHWQNLHTNEVRS